MRGFKAKMAGFAIGVGVKAGQVMFHGGLKGVKPKAGNAGARWRLNSGLACSGRFVYEENVFEQN